MSHDTVFVTVGTTKFDKLIKTVTKPEILKLLHDNGYKNIILQIGHGEILPEPSDLLNVSHYRLKESIRDDIEAADLVISHSGAGCCLEVLTLRKPLIAVVNEDLMGNHQMELGRKLSENNHMYYSSCGNLYDTLLKALPNLGSLKTYPNGNAILFSSYVDKCVGLCDD